MAIIVLSVDRGKLPEHTQEQFEEWVRFEVGERGGMSASNPLNWIDLECEVKEFG